METTTDFAKYLTKFFTEYLVGERGASSHTVRSYSDTFTLVLTYIFSAGENHCHLPVKTTTI
jgi:site-specific recombinase XerC